MSARAGPWPWPPPADDGGALHLVAGTRLPSVALEATIGRRINLAEVRDRAVVFVYPYTGTPGAPNPPGWDTIPGAHGSTPQAEGFRDHYAAFQDLKVGVFGISGQSQADQRAFAARISLPFPVLSDLGFAFADALQLPRFETGGVTFLKRITFLIRGGVIEQTLYPVHPPDRHAAAVYALVSQPQPV